MNLKKINCLVLSLLLLVMLLPCSVLAEKISSAAYEAKQLGKFDPVWDMLDKVEAEAIANGSGASEVTLAVYKAAVGCENIDELSFSDLDGNGFSFKVDGMAACYDYAVRNTEYSSSINKKDLLDTLYANKEGPSFLDVLLVGPYYGYDSNFTDQYVREATSIAEVTEGSVTELAGEFATAPSIVEHAVGAGVVIFDSHGGAYNGTSYLCLTVSAGLTTTDFNRGWAINGGSWFGIDGRYFENHVTDALPNNIFWMAICEGMKLSGNGVTGSALLRAGAGCVYGYSQSVSFYGDYIYEATFWNEIKNGATVAEAYNTMTAVHGNWDPAYNSPQNAAWPIVMSPVDAFPENPDSHQTVNCEWKLFGGTIEPVALESYTLSADSIELYRTHTASVQFTRNPVYANDFELVWRSDDESIASIEGSKLGAVITGNSAGVTDAYCDIYVHGELVESAPIHVNVLYFPDFNDAVNVSGGSLNFTSTTSNYPWKVCPDGEGFCVCSGNAGSSSSVSIMQLRVELNAGDTLNFRMKTSSETGFDTLGFYANSQLVGELLSGNIDWVDVSYTADHDGAYFFQWRFVKDQSIDGFEDCGYVDDVELIRAAAMQGDVNGDNAVTGADALLVLRYALSLVSLSPSQLQLADVNGNGIVDANDALMLMRIALSLN